MLCLVALIGIGTGLSGKVSSHQISPSKIKSWPSRPNRYMDIGPDVLPQPGTICLAGNSSYYGSLQGSSLQFSTFSKDLRPGSGIVQGPDLIVGNISGLAQFGSSGNQVGLAFGTDACNAGNIDAGWFALPNNDHPVDPQNLYRMSGGPNNDERFEQIGQSNVLHGLSALRQTAADLAAMVSAADISVPAVRRQTRPELMRGQTSVRVPG